MSATSQPEVLPRWVIAAACAGGLLALIAGAAVYHAFHGTSSASRPSLTPVLQQLRADGEAGAFSITGLRWNGDTVVVDTDLAPKAESYGPITGACTVVWPLVTTAGGFGIDAGSVMVYGQGVLGEEWFRGDAACHTAGSFG